MVARNNPVRKGIIDLRVTGYRPDARIFGAFAKLDTLLLLTWAPKTGLHYATEIGKCRATWGVMFPNHNPLIGASHEEYISNNVILG